MPQVLYVWNAALAAKVGLVILLRGDQILPGQLTRPTKEKDHSLESCGLSAMHSPQALGSLGRRQRLHPSIQPALVAACSVLVQHALLYALVQHRSGRTVVRHRLLVVALHDRLSQTSQRTTQLGSIGSVDRGLDFGLPRALQRRNMICHSSTLSDPEGSALGARLSLAQDIQANYRPI